MLIQGRGLASVMGTTGLEQHQKQYRVSVITCGVSPTALMRTCLWIGIFHTPGRTRVYWEQVQTRSRCCSLPPIDMACQSVFSLIQTSSRLHACAPSNIEGQSGMLGTIMLSTHTTDQMRYFLARVYAEAALIPDCCKKDTRPMLSKIRLFLTHYCIHKMNGSFRL